MLLTAEQRRTLFRHPAGWIGTGFGVGLSPLAPGTAGSLAALLPWLVLRDLAWPWYALALLLAFALGVWACAWIVRNLHSDDPGIAVWDEFVGLWLALTPLLFMPHSVVWMFAGFTLFRIFDIVKPWPVSWADQQVKGGFGVMLDDVLAGACAALLLSVLLRLA
jgi:phosphatidylglycerophosphatase A